MTPEFLAKWMIPAGLSFLPSTYNSPAARKLLVAIALQESGCRARRQHGNGPARSYWQFELIGVRGVLEHPKAGQLLTECAVTLGVTPIAESILGAIEHNDVLAAICARLNLWISPKPLPETQEEAWQYYLSTWRPGKPKPEAWPANWERAMSIPTNLLIKHE